MPDVNLSPYPYTAEQQALLRRRQLAQLLQQQAMAPVEEPSMPGVNISPVQGIAKMVQALIAARQNRQLDTQQQGLNARIQTERTRQASDIARAMIPQAQGTTANLPMAPTQAMPVPSTLPSQAPQLPDSPPYNPPASAPVTPEGTRSVPIPASSESIRQTQALAQAMASSDPMQQFYAQSMIQGLGQDRKEEFERELKRMEIAAAMNRPTGVGAQGLYIPGQGIIGKPPERPVVAPEGAAVGMPGGPFTIPSPKLPPLPSSMGSYTNAQGKHMQIMRQPDGTMKEVPFGDVREADQNVVVRTVNAQGQTVEKIVPKKPGAEYAAAPTAQETNRRDQAVIVNNYADHILQLIDQNPTAVGPILGRIARGEVAIGNVPDNVKALHTALGSFEALQPILHGFRGGSQTVDHFKTVIGDQHLNAAALKASINEIKTLAKTIDPGIDQQPAGGKTLVKPGGALEKLLNR